MGSEVSMEIDADKKTDQERNTLNNLMKKDDVVNDTDVANEEDKNANATDPTKASENKNTQKDKISQSIAGFLSNWTSYESIKKNLSPKSPRQSFKAKNNKNGTDSIESSDVKISDAANQKGPTVTDMNRNYPIS